MGSFRAMIMGARRNGRFLLKADPAIARLRSMDERGPEIPGPDDSGQVTKPEGDAGRGANRAVPC